MNLNKDDAYLRLRRGIGKRTLKLVCWIARQQHQSGRYYLIENPASSAAWSFNSLFQQLIDEAGGKFVVGHQCAYGAKDKASGRPVKKPTGWLSNCETLLNHLGRRCVCPSGSHEPVLGSNSFG